MAFCTKCGSNLSDGAQFCPSCGAPQNAANAAPVTPVAPVPAPTPAPATNRRQLHCPECKGTLITPVVETSVNGAVTTSHGNLSASKVSNSHRNYWMCSTCGTKFRNIQNLQEEIKATSKGVIIYAVLAAIGAILCLFFCSLASDVGIFGFLYYTVIFGCGLFAFICFCYIFVNLSKASKMKKELAYLEYNCFN